MKANATLLEYPKFSITPEGFKSSDPPYVAKIKYRNKDIILIGEYPEGEFSQHIIRKEKFLFPQVIYNATSNAWKWDINFFPFDMDTKHVAPTVLSYMLREMLCRLHGIEVIPCTKNWQFEDFFEKIVKTEGDIPNAANVPYLQNLPNNFLPAPGLCITVETALLCTTATEFIELVNIAEKQAARANAEVGLSPNYAEHLSKWANDMLSKGN